MTIDFVNILQLDARNLIMATNFNTRTCDILTQLIIEQKIDMYIGITPLDVVKHISHSRAESVEISLRPPLIFIFTYRFTSPTVVGSTKDEKDIRAS